MRPCVGRTQGGGQMYRKSRRGQRNSSPQWRRSVKGEETGRGNVTSGLLGFYFLPPEIPTIPVFPQQRLELSWLLCNARAGFKSPRLQHVSGVWGGGVGFLTRREPGEETLGKIRSA